MKKCRAKSQRPTVEAGKARSLWSVVGCCGLCRGKGYGKAGKRPFVSVHLCPRCGGSGKILNGASLEKELRKLGIDPDQAWKTFRDQVLNKAAPNIQRSETGEARSL